MNVFDAASANIATRQFQPGLIRKEQLKMILEATRLTQSAKNLQPWSFIIIKERNTLDALARLMKGDIDEELTKASPMVVAIVGDPRSEFWLFDLGRVTQTMTLVAWELGVGSCVISGPEPPDREDYRTKAGKILSVPDKMRFQELIAFGYPKNTRRVRRKDRKKLEEIVFSERFGQPADLGQ
jgi:nitroreductase